MVNHAVQLIVFLGSKDALRRGSGNEIRIKDRLITERPGQMPIVQNVAELTANIGFMATVFIITILVTKNFQIAIFAIRGGAIELLSFLLCFLMCCKY